MASLFKYSFWEQSLLQTDQSLLVVALCNAQMHTCQFKCLLLILRKFQEPAFYCMMLVPS